MTKFNTRNQVVVAPDAREFTWNLGFHTLIRMLAMFVGIMGSWSVVLTMAEASTVVVVSSSKHIVVGADSLVLTDHGPVKDCKIHPYKSFVFASAGYVENTEGFSIEKVVMRTIDESGDDLDKAGRVLVRNATKAFSDALTVTRRLDPLWYTKEIKEGGPEPLQVVISGVKSGIPAFVVVSFTIKSETAKEVKVESHLKACPSDKCPTGALLSLGENRSARNFVQHGEKPVEIVRKLVGAAIQDAPDRVGPPISIIEISLLGMNWIDRGACK